jgi:hypothetical protein
MDNVKYILNRFTLKLDGATKMPIEIPDVGRDNLPELFNELGFKVGAEIGVLKGDFSEKICKGVPRVKLYCVDPWKRVGGFDDYKDESLKLAYKLTKEKLKDYDCEIIKKTSMAAVKDFDDGALDFVYLDGDHEYRSVVNDISEWIKKVRVGGIIAGHDYKRYADARVRNHVVPAVGGYASAYQIRPWFVLGRKEAPEGEIRDKDRSWMWVKIS